MENCENPKNILITGDTGFIGRHLKKHIHENSPEVRIAGFNRKSGQDVRDLSQIFDAVCHKDLVIHLAGTSSAERSWKYPNATVEINATGSLNVMKSCLAAGVPLIHISSAEVYGSNLHPGCPMPEHHPLHPKNPFGVAKKAADVYANQLIESGKPIVCLRLFTPYGTGAAEKSDHFIPRLVRYALTDRNLPVKGNGEYRRDWVFIDEVAQAIWKSRLASPGAYNIATGVSHSYAELAEKILKAAASFKRTKSKIVMVQSASYLNEINEHCGDPSLFLAETGWRPGVSVEEGISRSINFYLS